jgi:hypothetical protein
MLDEFEFPLIIKETKFQREIYSIDSIEKVIKRGKNCLPIPRRRWLESTN